MHARLLPLALFAAACAGVPRNLDAPPKSGGTVLASVTMGYSGKFFEEISFWFRDARGRRFRLDSAVPWTIHPLLESTPDEGLESEHGLLYAIARPAGEYRLDEVRIHDMPARVARVDPPLLFTVAEGETVYIGNLHVELCHLQSSGGDPYYVAGGHPTARDRLERDLPLMQAKFPWLRGRTVERRVLDGRALREGARELWAKCPEGPGGE